MSRLIARAFVTPFVNPPCHSLRATAQHRSLFLQTGVDLKHTKQISNPIIRIYIYIGEKAGKNLSLCIHRLERRFGCSKFFHEFSTWNEQPRVIFFRVVAFKIFPRLHHLLFLLLLLLLFPFAANYATASPIGSLKPIGRVINNTDDRREGNSESICYRPTPDDPSSIVD